MRILLTRPVFQQLIQQLLFIEETAEDTADFYYPDSSEERKNLLEFLKQYVARIENEFTKVEVIDSIGKHIRLQDLNRFPYVIINSRAVLEIPGKASCLTYYLTFPEERGKTEHTVSYLSPLGKALLLHEVDSETTLPLPQGPTRCKINSVTLL